MKVHRIERYDNKFSLWVCAWDTHDWRMRHYLFKHEEGKVYFVVLGRLGGNRLIGEAQTTDEAIAIAADYLEKWLNECGALERPGRPPANCNEE